MCAGDCDADGTVGIAEVVTAVNVALGLAGLSACPAADANADLSVSTDEVVASVHGVPDGCSAAERPR